MEDSPTFLKYAGSLIVAISRALSKFLGVAGEIEGTPFEIIKLPSFNKNSLSILGR